jgi:hypothetical protein
MRWPEELCGLEVENRPKHLLLVPVAELSWITSLQITWDATPKQLIALLRRLVRLYSVPYIVNAACRPLSMHGADLLPPQSVIFW